MLKKSKDAGNIPTLGNSRFEERSAVQKRSKEIDRFPLEQGGLFLFVLVQRNNNRND
jgi:hypothetical protein